MSLSIEATSFGLLVRWKKNTKHPKKAKCISSWRRPRTRARTRARSCLLHVRKCLRTWTYFFSLYLSFSFISPLPALSIFLPFFPILLPLSFAFSLHSLSVLAFCFLLSLSLLSLSLLSLLFLKWLNSWWLWPLSVCGEVQNTDADWCLFALSRQLLLFLSDGNFRQEDGNILHD